MTRTVTKSMVASFHVQPSGRSVTEALQKPRSASAAGRYTGGIVPLGYRVDGHKHTARLAPDDSIIWSDWSAARLVQRIYEWLALDHKTCRWIANELNRLGVPTVYQRDGRGVRGKTTQAIWRGPAHSRSFCFLAKSRALVL